MGKTGRIYGRLYEKSLSFPVTNLEYNRFNNQRYRLLEEIATIKKLIVEECHFTIWTIPSFSN